MNRLLSAAFEKWQAEASELKRDKARLSGAIHRILHRHLSAAFEQWQTEAAALKLARERMSQAARRFIMGAVDGAFDVWRAYRTSVVAHRQGWEKWLAQLRLDALSRHDEEMRSMFDNLFTGGSSHWANAMRGRA